MTSFAQAWRALVRRRAFTLTTILTLAAGIGITTTMFSIVNAILLRPLPYPDGGQMVSVYEASPGQRERFSLIAPVRLDDWNRLNRTFTAISGSYAENVTDTSGAEPERLDGRRVMPRFFEVFGMAPLAGRTFVADEERFGGSTAVVISEALWARRFGRSPAAIGARLTIAGTGYTIVGVMPRAFTTASTDVWVPAQLSPGLMRVRDARFIGGVGRMKPGVTIDGGARGSRARANHPGGAVSRVRQGLVGGRQGPEGGPRRRLPPSVDPGVRRRRAAVRDCRGQRRRAAAGATAAARARVRDPDGDRRLAPADRRRGDARSAARGRRRRGRGCGIVVLAVERRSDGVPGDSADLGNRRGWPRAWIRGGSRLPRRHCSSDCCPRCSRRARRLPGRGVVGGRHRLQGAIVVAQLALGVVLAGSAGLLVRSYGAMTGVDAGFDSTGVLTFHVGAAWNEDRPRVGQMQVRLIEELQRLPASAPRASRTSCRAPGPRCASR